MTNETITKYIKLFNKPLLKYVLMKAMCIELGNLGQGYQDIKVTNTVKCMALNKSRHITNDCTVRYAIIVVDSRAQKKDLNQV